MKLNGEAQRLTLQDNQQQGGADNNPEEHQLSHHRIPFDAFQQQENREAFDGSLMQLNFEIQGEETDLRQVLDFREIFEWELQKALDNFRALKAAVIITIAYHSRRFSH